MAQFMRENFLIMKFTDTVNTNGLMAKFMRDNGRLIRCMEPEQYYGRIIECT